MAGVIILSVIGLYILWICGFFDFFSDKVKESKEKKHYGKEEIFHVTTYQNSNIKENDIIGLFRTYWKHHSNICMYCLWQFKVYSDKNEQNYAWALTVSKDSYGWGIVYNIRFHFSNGWISFQSSDSGFSSNGLSANNKLYSGNNNESVPRVCMEQARVMWKMHGLEPDGILPFNFNSAATKTETSNNFKKEKTGKHKNYDNTEDSQSREDMIAFYRKLLGLKLRFTQAELKIAYREAVGKYHPDRYGSSSARDRDNAEMLMKQVNEAYEFLKNTVNSR